MKYSLPDRFFVTGTDTEVGKTVVCAMLALGLGAKYWKPVQSGAVEGLDSRLVQELACLDFTRIIPEQYIFSEPLSPHLAAALENRTIEPDRIRLPQDDSPLIVEGAGGLLVPLNRGFLMADLIRQLDLPVLIVSRNMLGTINHTLLTIEALKHRGLRIEGVILNRGVKNQDHLEAIEQLGRVKVLGQMEELPGINSSILRQVFDELFL